MHASIRILIPAYALIIASPAVARAEAPNADPPTILISHDDLDLTKAADVAILNRRVSGAVNRVCPALTVSLRESTRVRKCRRMAAARAAGQVEIAIAAALESRPHMASANMSGTQAAQ